MKEFSVTNVLNNARMLVVLLILLLTTSLSFAQNGYETAKPLTDIEIVRKVAFLNIEGRDYENVKMIFKSISPDGFLSNKYKVKVKVVDNKRKTIYEKTFKNAFLYVFSDGQVHVGKGNFSQIIVIKSMTTGENIGAIREKEGVY